jgi:hypothetical protein
MQSVCNLLQYKIPHAAVSLTRLNSSLDISNTAVSAGSSEWRQQQLLTCCFVQVFEFVT